MKTFVILAACVVAALAGVPSEEEIQTHWMAFKSTYARTYASPVEEAYRAKVFKEHAIRIAKHNDRYASGEVTFKVGYNQFADLHTHEVTEQMNGYRAAAKKPSSKVFQAQEGKPRSKKVDWRSKGYVTPVKDQGQCGSCWSFSATGALEGQNFKKTGKLVSLSEQNLVDCSSDYGNEGCQGGVMDYAFEYAKDNEGLNTEEIYPYTATNGTCKVRSTQIVDLGTSGYVDVNPTEKDLQAAVSEIGPVSVAIDANHWSFQMYQSGIYHESACSSTELDHGVLAVGYGTDYPNKAYWIVKNSWGTSWGEAGYIRMTRNKKNQCGIATSASYPTTSGL